MKQTLYSILLSLLLVLPVSAEEPTAIDPRINLGMTAEEKAQFLSEMRQMLGSIQGILQGITSADPEMIAKFASQSGNRMARATPDALRNRLPQAFKELGGPTHMMFEEMVIRAETDDTKDLLKLTTDIINQCTACHAQFRAD